LKSSWPDNARDFAGLTRTEQIASVQAVAREDALDQLTDAQAAQALDL
jgi:hypothetical protein